MLSVLRLEDAEEMVSVLDDEGLYEFIGGVPPSLKELRSRYEHFLARPERTHETWLNWIVRRASDTVAIGTLQATLVTTASGQAVAELSWVIGRDGTSSASRARRPVRSSVGFGSGASRRCAPTSTPATTPPPW